MRIAGVTVALALVSCAFAAANAAPVVLSGETGTGTTYRFSARAGPEGICELLRYWIAEQTTGGSMGRDCFPMRGGRDVTGEWDVECDRGDLFVMGVAKRSRSLRWITKHSRTKLQMTEIAGRWVFALGLDTKSLPGRLADGRHTWLRLESKRTLCTGQVGGLPLRSVFYDF